MDEPRRSSRKRNSKGALELLGITSPKRLSKAAIKDDHATPLQKKGTPTTPNKENQSKKTKSRIEGNKKKEKNGDTPSKKLEENEKEDVEASPKRTTVTKTQESNQPVKVTKVALEENTTHSPRTSSRIKSIAQKEEISREVKGKPSTNRDTVSKPSVGSPRTSSRLNRNATQEKELEKLNINDTKVVSPPRLSKRSAKGRESIQDKDIEKKSDDDGQTVLEEQSRIIVGSTEIITSVPRTRSGSGKSDGKKETLKVIVDKNDASLDIRKGITEINSIKETKKKEIGVKIPSDTTIESSMEKSDNSDTKVMNVVLTRDDVEDNVEDSSDSKTDDDSVIISSDQISKIKEKEQDESKLIKNVITRFGKGVKVYRQTTKEEEQNKAVPLPENVIQMVSTENDTPIETVPTDAMADLTPDQQLAQQVLSALATGAQPGTTTSENRESVSYVEVQLDQSNKSGMVIVINPQDKPKDLTVTEITEEQFHEDLEEVEEDDQPKEFEERLDGSQAYKASFFQSKKQKQKVYTKASKQVVASERLKKLMSKLKPLDEMDKHTTISNVGVNKWHKCNYCSERISTLIEFRKHINVHASDIAYKPWKCPECDYRASLRAGIARHINIHSEIKPYVCLECGKGFNFKQKLTLHMKYHLDIRDRQCPHCEMAFHEYKTLKNHLIKIHNDPNYPLSRGKKGPVSKEGYDLDKLLEIAAKRREQQNLADAKLEEKKDGTEEAQASVSQEALDSNQETVKTESIRENTGEQNETNKTNEADTTGTPVNEKETGDTEENGQIPSMIPMQKIQEAPSDKPLIQKINLSKHSMLHGPRKTMINTQKYKSGSHPAKLYAKSHYLSKKGIGNIIDSQQTKGVNRRMLREDSQIEQCLLQFCEMTKMEGESRCSLRCNECKNENKESVFHNKTTFVRHLERNHPEIKPWACHHCTYKTRMRTSLIVHLKLHSGIRDHTCNVCGKGFPFKQKLKNHMKHHLNLREFKCEFCPKDFNERGDMVKHIKRVHVAGRPCICQVCGKGYKDQTLLKRHMDSHSEVKKYMCEHCNKFYRSKMSLAQHMKSHTCMFHCEICDKNFGSYSGFMAHKVMHDESYEGYKCELCNKTLHTKGSLTRHRQIAHSNERPWECEQCHKRFKTKKDCKHHEIVHIRVKNFVCEICQFQCKRIESLRIHMKRHEEQKPYLCGECGRQYTQKRALQNHLRTHTAGLDTMCDVCKRIFPNKQQLDLHMSKPHTAEDKTAEKAMTVFMCEECNSVFLTQDSLAVHILAEHMNQGWVGSMGLKFPTTLKTTKGVKTEKASTATNTSGESTELPMEVVAEETVSEVTEEQMFSGQEAVETLVTIADPSNRGKLVSLIHPIELKSENISVEGGQAVIETVIEEAVQDQINSETLSAEHKFAALLDPDSQQCGETATYVAITDPNTNQEMLVHSSNFETLLAATEAEVGSLEHSFHGEADGQTYVTIAETMEVVPEAHTSVVHLTDTTDLQDIQ